MEGKGWDGKRERKERGREGYRRGRAVKVKDGRRGRGKER